MKLRSRDFLIVLLLAGWLAACGNKGDLVLPDTPPETATPATSGNPPGEAAPPQ
jgi:predicted small lipoprotein YifL